MNQQFNQILCPTDFSEFSDLALKFAVQLAADNATIHVLYTSQVPYIQDPSGVLYMVDKMNEIEKTDQTHLDEVINGLNEKYAPLKFVGILKQNLSVADAILEAQSELESPIIVMGSHGRKGLSRLLMGSVAETVMREATCEVVLVKPKQISKK